MAEAGPAPGERSGFFKSSLCSFFRSSRGQCRNGAQCQYAHGEEELRVRPDGTWDPTSLRARMGAPPARPSEEPAGLEDAEGAALGGEPCESPGEAGPEEASPEGARAGAGREAATPEDLANGEGGNAANGGEDQGPDGADPEANGEGGGGVGLRLCVQHLPPWWKVVDLRQFLQKQGICATGVRKRRGYTDGFLTLHSQEEQKAAADKLQGQRVRGHELVVAAAEERRWGNAALGATGVGEGEQAADGEEQGADRGAAPEERPAPTAAWQAVAPLSAMPYAEQLTLKKSNTEHMLKRLCRKARKQYPRDRSVAFPHWVKAAPTRGGLPCEFLGVLPSPVIEGYRNKCEFTIGQSVAGTVCVGFQLGAFREGITAVGEAAGCRNVSRSAQEYAAIAQQLLQCSPLPAWSKRTSSGFWRLLMVREGKGPLEGSAESDRPAQVMLMFQVNPSGQDETAVHAELERLAQGIRSAAAKIEPPLALTCILAQEHTGVSNAAPEDCPVRVLFSAAPQVESRPGVPAGPSILDHLCGLAFRVSPTAFFQVNGAAAEELYNLAAEWLGLGPTRGGSAVGKSDAAGGALDPPEQVMKHDPSEETDGTEPGSNLESLPGVMLEEPVPPAPSLEEAAQPTSSPRGPADTVAEAAPSAEDSNAAAPEPQQQAAPRTLVFDVCCGTGTIGMLMARRATKVVGVDINPSAIADARANAAANGLTNCEFIAGKAEEVLPALLSCYATRALPPHDVAQAENMNDGEQEEIFDRIVAVVDPPRSGLHPIVIRALRENASIRDLL